MGKRLMVVLVSLLALVLAAGCGKTTGNESEQVNYPEKPINFVVPWSAGGGSDRMARMVADVIQSEKILPQPLVVVNKPGGSAAVGMNEVATKKGDPYTIIGIVSAQISNPLTTGAEVKASTFKPIAALALDEYMLFTKADSDLQSLNDVVEYAKANPGKLTVGGTGTGAEDQICLGLLQKSAGIKTEYVPFDSGGEVMSSLLGGHIQLAWANPSEAASQLKAGMVKAIGIMAPERISAYPDVPTFKEQGVDAEFRQIRGISGTPDMPDYAVKALADAMKKVSESERWQTEYIEKNGLTSQYMGPDEFAQAINDAEQEYKEVLTDLGQIK
ncbi:putative tricarboxylic transport membrane protein [Desulfotomaculum arcticum]|uniref:Putative tricarboxylic transport membrane protein n=1 Tax=Desulfotruncus arcticus DSM 17038 TaxID=1121424 RepID=A0A1I2TFF6_9FIRM|nr:tripartite tricarboxylate transporter substrate binding protein [Desulfotruncus arcticus]SFG63618.1 putative tricarboxylic transport membrane protein [Desulfotomaculum arcticum] [Desulfotruncus arcticus DSM 17038]